MLNHKRAFCIKVFLGIAEFINLAILLSCLRVDFLHTAATIYLWTNTSGILSKYLSILSFLTSQSEKFQMSSAGCIPKTIWQLSCDLEVITDWLDRII